MYSSLTTADNLYSANLISLQDAFSAALDAKSE